MRPPWNKPCPASGTGVHGWIFYAAKCCFESGIPEAVSVDLIEAALTRPQTPGDEVEKTVEAAYNGRSTGGGMRWPERDLNATTAILEAGRGISALEEKSPVTKPGQNDVLMSLFPDGELVCIGRTVASAQVEELKFPCDYSAAQFIVPNPMTARTGLTQDGRTTARSLSNTGRRRWLIIECDFSEEDQDRTGFSSFDLCAAVIHRLSDYRPPAVVVHSGGKSLHSWFPVLPGEDETPSTGGLWLFMALAVRLGADPKMWTRCQWARMPWGTRRTFEGTPKLGEDGAPILQRVIYFDPAVSWRAIEEKSHES
jgi:hypothetical protein